MALREFVDRSGLAWTVWDMVPEHMHRASRNSLGPFAEGWLCFEAATGEKRRLSPIPAGWDFVPDDALEALCERATPARARPAGERARER
jgi:hypothetical protein